MPSLAVLLPWVVVIMATLAVRGWFAVSDASAHLPTEQSNRTMSEWDDGTEPLPARAVVSGQRIHLWIPRHRRLVIVPAGSTETALPRTDAWRVDVPGHAPAALYDVDGTLAQSLTDTGARPHRLSLRDRLFLNTPRWTVSALLGCLILGTSMIGLTTLGEHHRVTVDHILTADDDTDCVVNWPGRRVQDPHVTACPADDDQHVRDRIDVVRLPASDYVVATDDSHLTYVSFLAYAGAAFFALLTLFLAGWRMMLRRERGTYAPMSTTPLTLDAAPPTPAAHIGQEQSEETVEPATTADSTDLTPSLRPGAWAGLLDDDSPVRPPAHTGNLRRRLTWRLDVLPLPWSSVWLAAVCGNHLDAHRIALIPLLIVALFFVVRGLVRSVRSWCRAHRDPDPRAPRSSFTYVRLPRPRGRRARNAKDTVLVIDPRDPDGAWLLELDGTPAATGTITVVGTLPETVHPRVNVAGQIFETAGDPIWLDNEEVEGIRDDLEQRSRTRSL